MMKHLLDTGAAADIVCLPPVLKLGASLSKLIQELVKLRIASPKIISRSE